jgi:hypothetical protein
MTHKTFKYVNFDGKEVEEEYYFHLSKAELMEMELSAYGGLEMLIKRLIEEKNSEEIVKIFKKIILSSVGQKSYDGNRFIKNDEIRTNFYQTEAYSQLFCELIQNPDYANEFINAVIGAQPTVNADKANNEANVQALPAT